MPIRKKDCPDCCTYTITIKSPNCNVVYDEQNDLKKRKIPKGNRTVEFVVNKIIKEWGNWKNHNT